MDIPYFSRKQLTLAILAASAAPAGQADTTDEILQGLDNAPEQITVSESSQNSGVIQNPDLAQDAEGNFIVAWQEEGSTNEDVLVQRFNADGSKIDDNPLEVASGSSDDTHLNPSVAMDDNGNAVVTWQRRDPADSSCSGHILQRALDSGEQDFPDPAASVVQGSPGIGSSLCDPAIAMDGGRGLRHRLGRR